eukprot:CAMPEP_0119395668 /NCGR_PEP_ID=MMETSP1334-20130426/134208_1 /TAXON_ID=127549 /ORGANISM="Calcidiscus leptoporus, Strain RCC1130" /LENGTH=77 /DNA_ID=CAMNT_0007419195 /DNA_START=352 /DNA_END=582 /DNA_ORIENTATION=-
MHDETAGVCSAMRAMRSRHCCAAARSSALTRPLELRPRQVEHRRVERVAGGRRLRSELANDQNAVCPATQAAKRREL